MDLTEKQIDAVHNISHGLINSFVDFLQLSFVDLEHFKAFDNSKSDGQRFINVVMYDFYDELNRILGFENTDNVQTLYDQLTGFISLMKTFEEHHLIFMHESKPSNYYPAILILNKISRRYEFHDSTINDIIFAYKDVQIFKSPYLDTFIENDFKTTDELRSESEENFRKKSLNRTLWIAIGSIAVSLIATLFNIFLSNKYREVHLTNPSPTEIRITNIDSINQKLQFILTQDSLKNKIDTINKSK